MATMTHSDFGTTPARPNGAKLVQRNLFAALPPSGGVQVEEGEIPGGVEPQQFRAVRDARAETQQETFRQRHEQIRAAEKILKEAFQNMGAQGYDHWRRHVAHERSRTDMRKNTPRPDQRAETIGELDLEPLRAISHWARDRLDQLFTAPRDAYARTAQMISEKSAQMTRNDPAGSPWVTFVPAYMLQDALSNKFLSGYYSFTFNSHENALTGDVGQRVHNTIDEASDLDVGWASNLSTIAIVFTATETGPIEVVLEAQSLIAHHHLILSGDVRDSDATIKQQNSITFETFPRGSTPRQSVPMSWLELYDKQEGNWDEHSIPAGESRWFRFISDRSFQEGEVVWIDIGSYSTNFVFTNDIAIDSSMNFKWFLRQILVRSTGVS